MWFYRQHPEYSSVHDFGIIVAVPNFTPDYDEFIKVCDAFNEMVTTVPLTFAFKSACYDVVMW